MAADVESTRGLVVLVEEHGFALEQVRERGNVGGGDAEFLVIIGRGSEGIALRGLEFQQGKDGWWPRRRGGFRDGRHQRDFAFGAGEGLADFGQARGWKRNEVEPLNVESRGGGVVEEKIVVLRIEEFLDGLGLRGRGIGVITPDNVVADGEDGGRVFRHGIVCARTSAQRQDGRRERRGKGRGQRDGAKSREDARRKNQQESARRMRATVRFSSFRASACSQTRSTRQPLALSRRLTSRSRRRLRAILASQNLRLDFGRR